MTPDVTDFLKIDAPFAEENNLPEAGGVNDQTHSFLIHLRQYRDENSHYRSLVE